MATKQLSRNIHKRLFSSEASKGRIDLSTMLFGHPTGAFQMNKFVVGCPETKEAALIDCGAETDQEMSLFTEWLGSKEYKVTKILQTHAHLDHVLGIPNALSVFPKMPVHIHSFEEKNWNECMERANQYGLSPRYSSLPDWHDKDELEVVLVDDIDSVQVGNLKFRVLFTPGHSPGHVCFYNDTHKFMFGGDLLFQGSIGRTDLPYCSPDDMMKSLKNVFDELSDDVLVLPGHGNPTTIGNERSTNPFVAQALS